MGSVQIDQIAGLRVASVHTIVSVHITNIVAPKRATNSGSENS
jgi:hypothetical protein